MAVMQISTINQPEFINLEPIDINPLMSKCTIKVLYIGENRNRTFISKEVAAEMAKTLRGAPIVGYFNGEQNDFRDHGDRITIDGDGISFDCLTKPYGFVSPDAQIWFQKFQESDEFGNEIEREYLMTNGFLWTGQYEELQVLTGDPHPQSMELDSENLNGNWATNPKNGIEFFIINDAIFSKLCILGKDVEPCFEGANISTSFALNQDFTKTLYSMMQDLKFVLEGEQTMEKLEVEEQSKNFSLEEDKIDETIVEENKVTVEETSYVQSSNSDEGKKEEVIIEETSYAQSSDNDEKDKEEEKTPPQEDEDEDEENKKYSLLQERYEALMNDFSALEAKYQELDTFKKQIEEQKKDEMINSFYMLSDEDKKDVIENKSKYTVDDIEAKLSIIYTKKQLATEQFNQNENSNIFTYTFGEQYSDAPDWIQAVREVEENNN